MKRWLFVLLLFVSITASAQTLPEWMRSDYVGATSPINVQLKLVDYHTPWSMPNPTMSYVLFGTAEFQGETGAELMILAMGSMHCGSPIGCYAYNVRPFQASQYFHWHGQHQSYLWMDHTGPEHLFSVLAVDLPTNSAYWASGTFYDDGSGTWAIHAGWMYSLYLVEPLTMPVVIYTEPEGTVD